MKRRLLSWLVCPSCEAEVRLEVREERDGEILEGDLRCGQCHRAYPIRGGIPRMLPDEVPVPAQETARQFGDQWTQRFPDFMVGYERQFLDWIKPVEPSFFAGKTVLEGGCGMGRHAQLAASYGAREVVAVDLGHAVEAAYARTKHLPNVHIVQADLTHLPFRRERFDYVYSIAVLHHTANPGGSFASLVSHLKPGGRVSAWVYGREGNGWVVHLVNPIRSWITSKLPSTVLYALSWLLTLTLLYPLLKLVYRPLNRWAPKAARHLFYHDYLTYISQFHLRFIALIVYDQLVPSIAYYVRQEDFRRWFEAAGLEDVTIIWHNANSWRGTARRPAVVSEPVLVGTRP